MVTQWIASWKERGMNGAPDKRLVLVMEDYDYAFKMEELVENKYVERGKIVIPHQSTDMNRLLQGFFHKLQTLKSKTFTAGDKAPAPVLFDVTLPIFKNGSVDVLRFTSVNLVEGDKFKRESILYIYKFPSYEVYKDINAKIPERGQLKVIPSEYLVSSIKFSNMPITNGSFVYNDCAIIDSIAHALDASEAARIWHATVKQLDAMAAQQNNGQSNNSNTTTETYTRNDSAHGLSEESNSSYTESYERPY